jgi:hypothetical protein
MAYFAHGLLGAAVNAGKGKSRRRDVIVVTMVGLALLTVINTQLTRPGPAKSWLSPEG